MKQSLMYALTAALITALAITSEPASAQSNGPVETRVVQIGDLNLDSDAGRHSFEIRLARAAREVCGTASDSDLAGQNDVRQCRQETIAKASRVGVAQLANRGSVIAVSASR